MRPVFSLIIFFVIITSGLFYAQEEYLYELSKIEFEGNKEISAGELKTVIYSEETPWWLFKFVNSFSSFGKAPVYFDSSNIPIDLQALRAYYKANGFFRADFGYSYSKDTTDKEITLTYNITENEPSKYNKITLLGIDSLPPHILNRVFAEIGISKGQLYKQSNVELSIAHTLDVLLNRGYMLVKHDSTVIYIDTLQNTVDLNIYLETGNRYKISEVNVTKKGEGAEHVSEELIIYLTNIQPEEYYNREEIKNSQNRLARTGLFNSLILDASKKDTSGDYVPLMIEGNIGHMNEFLPGIAMNNEFGVFNFIVNANYTRKNFLGDARRLTLSTEVGVIDIPHFNFAEFFSERNYNIDGYASVNLKLEQPYLFAKPITGILDNYFQTTTFNRVNEKTYGIKASFEFDLPFYTIINQFKPYYNLEFYEAKVKDYQNNSLFAYYHDAVLNNATSIIGFQIGSAKANNLFFPTSGTNQLLSLEGAVSYGKYTVDLERGYEEDGIVTLLGDREVISEEATALFYRAEYTSAVYLPLSSDHSSVFATKTKLGYIQTFKGDASLVPFNRTFFVGGSNSVRGWSTRGLPKLGTENDLDPSDFLNVIILNDTTKERSVRGGTFLFEGSFEFRKRFLETIGAVLFLDYGNAWNGYGDFRFDDVALAAGFGFRYYSAIAPFRIDFGFKLFDPIEKKFIWDAWDPRFLHNISIHFGIGEAF